MDRCERDLREVLKGKTIKRVTVSDCYTYEITGKWIECDDGYIYFEFTDGTKLKIWNSEWGGIELE